MQRKAIQGIVVALVAMGTIGVQAAEPITIINADFQQDEPNLVAVAPNQWINGITNWVQFNSGVQWDKSGDPSNINAWINAGGWVKAHALATDLSSFPLASNQSITVTFDLATGANSALSYAVEAYSTDGDILLATTGDIDISALASETWYPAQSHSLQWLGATPSTNGFDIVIRQPSGQVWLDNVVVSNDDPDPTPAAPVWSVDPITGDSGLLGHAYTGTLAGLATDPNWDVVEYSRGPIGESWLVVAADGTLSGTPTSDSSQTFTVIASDGVLSATATLNIDVGTPTAPVWNPNPVTIPMPAFVGVPYSNSVASYLTEPDGDAITYIIETGPAWLSVDSATGEISGTPTEIGAAPNVFTIRATDLDGTDVGTFNITVIDGSGKVIVVLDAGGVSNGSDQTVTDLSTGGETFEGTAVFSSIANAGYASQGLPANNARWGDDEFDLDPTTTNIASYTYSNLRVGTEWDVYVSWKSEEQGNNSTAVPYSINGGTPIYVNQTVANPNDLTLYDGTHDVWFMKLGTATVGAESNVTVTVSASSGGWAVCDAIALVTTPLAPTDPAEDLMISGPVSGGTEMVISWTALKGGTYTLESNSNLIMSNGWQPFATGLSKWGGGTITVTNTIGSGPSFFRVITE